MRKNILIWIFAVFLLVQTVSGALNCNDITFYESAGAKCDGTNFTVYYDNSNAFAPNVNLTLNYTSTSLTNVSGDNPAVNVNAPYSWKFNCSQDGTYDFNLTVEDTTSSDVCNKNMSLSLTTGIQNPNITLQLDDLTTLVMNKSVNFSLLLNNTGNGTAFNISGFLNDNAVFNSTSINLSSLENNTVATIDYSMVPTACGADTLTATVDNYKNSIGQLMNPVSDNDNFNVVGTDLTVLSIDLSSTSLTEGNTLTINASIKNQGGYNASGSKIAFYYDNVSANKKITTLNLNDSNLLINGTDNVSTIWSVAEGTYRIYGIVSSSYECPLDNNQEQSLELTAGARTEDSSSGGSSTRSTTSPDAPLSIIKTEQLIGSAYMWISIPPNKIITMNVNKEELAITKISFMLKEKAENVKINVKSSEEMPSGVKEIEEEVYQYLIIEHENLDGKVKIPITAEFKVEKEWLNKNKLNKETVKLNRYTKDKWVELKTKVKNEDNNDIYYSANTPGFSVFAITAEKIKEAVKEAKNETKEEKEEKTVEEKKEEKKTKRFALIDKIKNIEAVLKERASNGIDALKGLFSKTVYEARKFLSIEEVRFALLGFVILGILIAVISGFKKPKQKKKKRKKKK